MPYGVYDEFYFFNLIELIYFKLYKINYNINDFAKIFSKLD